MKFRVCASFNADFPVDAEFDRPEGCYLARRFVQSLRTAHFDVGEFDNWRDCGWSVPCNVNEARFRVCFAHYSKHEEWQLFIEPVGMPGFFTRLIGKKAPRYISMLQRISERVETVLTHEPMVTQLRWRLNEDPRKSGISSTSLLEWPTDAVT